MGNSASERVLSGDQSIDALEASEGEFLHNFVARMQRLAIAVAERLSAIH